MIWQIWDDLTKSLFWFLSLFCLSGRPMQEVDGIPANCRNGELWAADPSISPFEPEVHSAQKYFSVSVSALQCVTGVCWLVYVHLVSTGSHMYVGLSFNLVQYSQVYIGVPWFAPISTGCSMHLLWSSTGVPWCRVHWCIPGVHWKARNQFGARVRATRPAPQSPLLWPHGHSCGTGQGGGWGGPDPPFQDWGDPHPTNKTPSSCPPVQWLQAGGPTIEEVLGPFWEVQQVEGGGPGRAEDVGPGGAPLHSGRLLLLPSLGCGKPSSGEIMIMQEMQDYFRQWNMKTIYFGIFNKIYGSNNY